jgi:hypothetical protein
MIRPLTPPLVFVLALAACSPSDTGATSPVDTTSTTLTTAPPPPRAAQLEYGYEPGSTITYDIEITQDITFDAAGDADRFGDDALPIDADLVTESTGRTTYSVAADPAPDNLRLDIVASFPDTRVAGTVNGSTVDNLEEGGVETDLARIEAVDVQIVIDTLGRQWVPTESGETMFGADLAALTGLTNDLFTTPVGPVFAPARQVTVGDSWDSETERLGQSGPIAVRSTSTVVDAVDDELVIETNTVTDAYRVDFSDQFRELFLEFAEIEEGAEVPEDVEEQLEAIEFVIEVDESAVFERARFDPAQGLVTTSMKTSTIRLSMVFRAPGEEGELSGFEIRLDVAQNALFSMAN